MQQTDADRNKEIHFRDKLISILSHDVKGLLSNIYWMIEAVENGMDSPEMLADMTKELRVHADKNIQLFNDTVTWMKALQINDNPLITEMTAEGLFEKLKSYFHADISTRKINPILAKGENISWQGDEAAVFFVLKNLTREAINFSDKEKNVIFRFERFEENVEASIVFQSGNPDCLMMLSDTYGEENLKKNESDLLLKYISDILKIAKGTVDVAENSDSAIVLKLVLHP